jgi:hypothetical protein
MRKVLVSGKRYGLFVKKDRWVRKIFAVEISVGKPSRLKKFL